MFAWCLRAGTVSVVNISFSSSECGVLPGDCPINGHTASLFSKQAQLCL